MLAILAPGRIVGVYDAIAASAEFGERRRLAGSRHPRDQDPRHRDNATECQASARVVPSAVCRAGHLTSPAWPRDRGFCARRRRGACERDCPARATSDRLGRPSVDWSAVACPSGRRDTPGKRGGQLPRGFDPSATAETLEGSRRWGIAIARSVNNPVLSEAEPLAPGPTPYVPSQNGGCNQHPSRQIEERDFRRDRRPNDAGDCARSQISQALHAGKKAERRSSDVRRRPGGYRGVLGRLHAPNPNARQYKGTEQKAHARADDRQGCVRNQEGQRPT